MVGSVSLAKKSDLEVCHAAYSSVRFLFLLGIGAFKSSPVGGAAACYFYQPLGR